MNRRLTASVALAAAAAVAVVPAQAAPKKKPKPIKGSYSVALPPDPTKEATSVTTDGCSGLVPVSKDSHPFTAPAAGTLKVSLAGQTPDGSPSTAGLDWDLYLLHDGAVEAASDSASSHEEVFVKVRKKTAFTFDVCNLDGLPNATISYVFTYR